MFLHRRVVFQSGWWCHFDLNPAYMKKLDYSICCLFRQLYIIVISVISRNLIPLSIYRINLFPPGQNGRHFADDVFNCISMNANFCILIQISQKFVPKGPNDNTSVLVLVIGWRRAGDLVHWHIYAALGGNESRETACVRGIVVLLSRVIAMTWLG